MLAYEMQIIVLMGHNKFHGAVYVNRNTNAYGLMV